MNRIFKTIWSYSLNRPVVTDELHRAKQGKKSSKTATLAVLASAVSLIAGGAQADDGWNIVNNPDTLTNISLGNQKMMFRSDGDIFVQSATGSRLVNLYNADLQFLANGSVNFTLNSPSDNLDEPSHGLFVYGYPETEDRVSLFASAKDISISVNSQGSGNGIRLHDGGRVQVKAKDNLIIKANGSGGQQYGVIAYKGEGQSAVAFLSAEEIDLGVSLDTKSIDVVAGEDPIFMRESAYVIRTQGSDTQGGNIVPEIYVGTDGADLIKLTASIDGVGNVGALRGEKWGTINIGTADQSVIIVDVSAKNNEAGKNGTFTTHDGKRVAFDVSGLYFGGAESVMKLQGQLLDVKVDGGSIGASGFRINRGGTLLVDAPMLMTVTSSFAPDLTTEYKGQEQEVANVIGRRNNGLVIGAKLNDGGGTEATFDKPVTVIVTNNGVNESNATNKKGQAVAVFIESKSTLNFNANTLLIAGNNPQAEVLNTIEALRSAGDINGLSDLAGSLQKTLGQSWRDEFSVGTASCGIRIGDDSAVNFNAGESTIIANTMFQKRNQDHVGTGAINVGSGAKLTITTNDISAGTVNVKDGGVLNTTSRQMNVTGVGKINNDGVVAAENFIISAGGQVNQNAGLMTVNNLDVREDGHLTVNGGKLSIAQTLKNEAGTISLKQGSEVIISSDAIGLTDTNGYNGNSNSWTLPEGVHSIANSGGIITVNVSKDKQKLTVGQYNSLKGKILDKLLAEGSTGSIRFGNYELENFTYEALKDQLIAWNPETNPEEFANQTIENVDGGLYGSWQGVTLKQGNHEVTLDGDLKFSGKKPVVKADGSIGGVNTGNKTFTATGDAELSHVTDGGSGQGKFVVEGNSTVNDINIGTLTVANGASISADTLNVGVATVDGNSHIGHLGSGILFADPAFNSDGKLSFAEASRNTVGSVGASATVEAGQGSIWAIGEGATLADAEHALQSLGFTELSENELKSAVYVSTSGTYQGTLLVTGRTDEDRAADVTAGGRAGTRQVYVDGQTGLFIDASKNDGFTPLFAGDMTFASGSILGLVNVSDDFYVLLTEGTITDEGAILRSDNPYVQPILSSNGVGTTIGARIDNAGLARAVSSMGIQSVARRADSRMAGLIADRAADQTAFDDGLNLWVDAAGERYRSNEFAGSSKFRADLAYAAFGGDIDVADGFRFGLAVGHTDGSVRSDGLKNSVGGFLVSAYGMAYVTDGLRAVADITYTNTENEVRSERRKVLNNDIDAQVFSAGFELQTPFAFGAFDLTPGIGLRLSRIESDSFKVGAVKINKGEMNLVQVPMTLRVKTDAIEAAGWSFTPNARIAFTPSFGDRSVKVRSVDQTVLDMSPFEADFGLTAAKGNFSLGAALTTGAGQHGSCSIGGKIRMGYTF